MLAPPMSTMIPPAPARLPEKVVVRPLAAASVTFVIPPAPKVMGAAKVTLPELPLVMATPLALTIPVTPFVTKAAHALIACLAACGFEDLKRFAFESAGYCSPGFSRLPRTA